MEPSSQRTVIFITKEKKYMKGIILVTFSICYLDNIVQSNTLKFISSHRWIGINQENTGACTLKPGLHASPQHTPEVHKSKKREAGGRSTFQHRRRKHTLECRNYAAIVL